MLVYRTLNVFSKEIILRPEGPLETNSHFSLPDLEILTVEGGGRIPTMALPNIDTSSYPRLHAGKSIREMFSENVTKINPYFFPSIVV